MFRFHIPVLVSLLMFGLVSPAMAGNGNPPTIEADYEFLPGGTMIRISGTVTDENLATVDVIMAGSAQILIQVDVDPNTGEFSIDYPYIPGDTIELEAIDEEDLTDTEVLRIR